MTALCPKKTNPPSSAYQEQGRVVNMASGESHKYMWTGFRNEFDADTALIGDSIIDKICVHGVKTWFGSGGKVSDMYKIIPTLNSKKKIVVALGGNNLSLYNEPAHTLGSVLEELRYLEEARKKLARCLMWLFARFSDD